MRSGLEEGTAATRASNPPAGARVDETGQADAPSDSGMRASIGHYALVAKLGQGGMADVHLAVDRGPIDDFHKLVVLKRLRASLRSDREYVDMFLKEARIAARLSHPNVVQTYSVEVEEDRTCIVMEYLEGVSLSLLAKRMRGRPLADRLLLIGALAETLAGLEYVHTFKDYDGKSIGLVHRDIKPGNIFVTFDGHVKLLDFGVTKATETDNTASMAIKGTARYMAPEMVGESPKIDRRADLFSTGVVLWELASGKKLWAGVNNLQILRRLADNEVPPVDSVSDDVPEELARICARALQCDPADRYQSARDFKADLDAFLRDQGLGSVGPDLARIATEEFSELRTSRSEAIRARLKQLSEAGAATAAEVPIFSSGSNSSVPGPGSTEVVSSSIPRPAGARWGAWAAVGTVLVLAAGGVVYGAFGRTSPATETAPAATAESVPAPTPALEEPAAPETDPPPPSEPENPTPAPAVDAPAQPEVVAEVEEPEPEVKPRPARTKARPKNTAEPKTAEPAPAPAGVEPGQLPGKKSKRKSKLALDKDDPWE